MVAIVALFAALYSQFKEFADLEFIKAQRGKFESFYADNPTTVIVAYFLGYITVAALSLPGAAILTLLAGAIFGVSVGVVVVSFASAIGATLAFLVARFLLGKTLQAKYGDKLRRVNEGVQKEGKFYLFTMRLIPAFPFFLINILMGLTPLRVGAFYWVSQLGMLPGTIVYVNAGTQLAKIDSLKRHSHFRDNCLFRRAWPVPARRQKNHRRVSRARRQGANAAAAAAVFLISRFELFSNRQCQNTNTTSSSSAPARPVL